MRINRFRPEMRGNLEKKSNLVQRPENQDNYIPPELEV